MQMWKRENLWTQQGKERVGRTGRVGLTHICYHVGNRQLVGSCRIEQGAEPGALW